MSLVKRGKVYFWRKMINGHSLSRSTKTGDKRLAEQLAATWEAEAVKEIVLEKRTPALLRSAVDEFTDERQHLTSYRNCVNCMKRMTDALPNIDLKDVTDKHVTDAVQQLHKDGLAIATIRGISGYWNSFVRWCELRKRTFIPRIKPPKAPGRIRWLTKEEEQRVLEVLDPTKVPTRRPDPKMRAERECNYAFTLFLLDTGARLNEAQNMDMRQLHLDAEEPWVLIHRSKGGADTTLLLTKRLIAAMRQWLAVRESVPEWKDSNFLFPSKVVAPGTIRIEHYFARAAKKAGLSTHEGKVTLHTLRHTFITRLAQKGVPVQDLQVLAGHRNVNVTLNYVHLVPGNAAQKAKALMDAD